ncbi:MAG TPA: hypothetical protein VHB98_08495, partial [Chloroflexota bacterium]|nr:hypothetical protein [Chloroflexota bacterium]
TSPSLYPTRRPSGHVLTGDAVPARARGRDARQRTRVNTGSRQQDQNRGYRYTAPRAPAMRWF